MEGRRSPAIGSSVCSVSYPAASLASSDVATNPRSASIVSTRTVCGTSSSTTATAFPRCGPSTIRPSPNCDTSSLRLSSSHPLSPSETCATSLGFMALHQMGLRVSSRHSSSASSSSEEPREESRGRKSKEKHSWSWQWKTSASETVDATLTGEASSCGAPFDDTSSVGAVKREAGLWWAMVIARRTSHSAQRRGSSTLLYAYTAPIK
ncbi:hypothetical protein OH76DRAFT_769114 [Lentinus brumalis]|uniref:Uncharacterized protein n=1 Tax=Lentinus brumalis TaxID=2498619 RepID=A0A371D4P1_9APHY|nr:hypothetical protein OH76DRAFT_769114 [Polyporus brumalis]